jgi:hypothetical protein
MLESACHGLERLRGNLPRRVAPQSSSYSTHEFYRLPVGQNCMKKRRAAPSTTK